MKYCGSDSLSLESPLFKRVAHEGKSRGRGEGRPASRSNKCACCQFSWTLPSQATPPHLQDCHIYTNNPVNIACMIPHTLSLSRGLSIFKESLPYFLFTGQTWLVIADKCYCESGPCWQPIGNLGDIYLKPSHIFNHTTHFEGTQHFR